MTTLVKQGISRVLKSPESHSRSQGGSEICLKVRVQSCRCWQGKHRGMWLTLETSELHLQNATSLKLKMLKSAMFLFSWLKGLWSPQSVSGDSLYFGCTIYVNERVSPAAIRWPIRRVCANVENNCFESLAFHSELRHLWVFKFEREPTKGQGIRKFTTHTLQATRLKTANTVPVRKVYE